MQSWSVDKSKSTTKGGFFGIAFITGMALVTLLIAKNINKARDIEVAASGRFDLVEKKLVKLTNNMDNYSSRAQKVDFSSVSCCKALTDQYEREGIVFERDESSGWITYQANGFVNHASMTPTEPGAPEGVSGTKITFTKPVKRAGMYIQGGSPFSMSRESIGKELKVTVYDNSGSAVFERDVDTCYNESISCTPMFIGLEGKTPIIRSIEISILEAYSYSIDDLIWEK